MAIKSTVFKAELQITDMDRNYYQSHLLTIARHPSESDARMMVRLLAFALHASPSLQFTKGISADDEPDLWQKNLSDEIELWIDLGQPDDKRIRKACGRARQVIIYNYQQRSGAAWWQQHANKLARFSNLSIVSLDDETVAGFCGMAQRTMQLSYTIQDGQIWLSDGEHTVEIAVESWKNIRT
ncbi:MAG: YaeQ family protein [Mariprofundales bacterium]|nr:YaeQ family protein [Mariprofundales bacterium]